MARRRRRMFWGFVILVILLFLAGSRLGGRYVDWLWFRQLGIAHVFWVRVWGGWAVALVGGLFFGLVTFLNLWLAKPGLGHLPEQVVPPEIQRWLRRARLGWLLAGVAALMAFIAGLSLGSDWLTVMRFLNAQPFGGAPDPIFHKDVGFYVFQLPFWTLVYHTLSTLFFFNAVLAGVMYALGGFLNVFSGRLQVHPRARIHLAVVVAGFFVFKAWGYLLSAYGLLYSSRGAAYGAGYTDIHTVLPSLRILMILALVVAAVALVNAFRNAFRLMAFGVVALLGVSLLLGTVWPAVWQRLIVTPNEIALETPYIKNDIAFTRRAYDLDRVEQQSFPATEDITAKDVTDKNPTIANIRLWDADIMGQAYQQLQGLRSYYSFDDMDVDRYTVDGRLRQVLLAAREIDYSKLPGQTWINQHIKYTHGYGVAASPANQVGQDGFPAFWVKDVPPTAEDQALKITQPAIYFGEQTSQYVIVDTDEQEFDYPQGQQNAYSHYQGHGGIPVGPLLNRLAMAFHVGNYNVLISGAVNSHSRAMIYRNIQQRVKKIAPYLLYDGDPYIVVDQGRLVWIQDAYTYTSRFPYSKPYQAGVNYIRNSVKITIDAYNGDTRFYVADPSDPIIQTYARIFPGLYHPLSSMPAALRKHIRYPEELFKVQGQMYARYHMTDPQVFYNSEDLWQVAQETASGQPQPVQPYYAVLELPGDTQPEFILLRPYTPKGRANMVAWLGARSDPAHYGEIIAFLFPKDKNVLGTQQVDSTINSTPAVSQALTLWSQQGSQVTRGNLLVIPMQNSLLYVEPLYLQGRDSPLPRLKRVIVAYGDQVAMGLTLEDALGQIFGGQPGAPSGSEAPPSEAPPSGPGGQGTAAGQAALIDRANTLFKEAQDALRDGDFATYGEKIKALGTVLDELRSDAGGAAGTPAGSTPAGPGASQ